MAATTADLVRQFVELNDEIKLQEDENETRKTKRMLLEEELLRRFENAEVNTMGVLGKTVYIHRQLWSKNMGDSSETVIALKESGLNDLVEEKFNSNRLSAYIREVAKEHTVLSGIPPSCTEIRELLPKPLQAVIDVTERISLRVRR